LSLRSLRKYYTKRNNVTIEFQNLAPKILCGALFSPIKIRWKTSLLFNSAVLSFYTRKSFFSSRIRTLLFVFIFRLAILLFSLQSGVVLFAHAYLVHILYTFTIGVKLIYVGPMSHGSYTHYKCVYNICRTYMWTNLIFLKSVRLFVPFLFTFSLFFFFFFFFFFFCLVWDCCFILFVWLPHDASAQASRSQPFQPSSFPFVFVGPWFHFVLILLTIHLLLSQTSIFNSLSRLVVFAHALRSHVSSRFRMGIKFRIYLLNLFHTQF